MVKVLIFLRSGEWLFVTVDVDLEAPAAVSCKRLILHDHGRADKLPIEPRGALQLRQNWMTVDFSLCVGPLGHLEGGKRRLRPPRMARADRQAASAPPRSICSFTFRPLHLFQPTSRREARGGAVILIYFTKTPSGSSNIHDHDSCAFQEIIEIGFFCFKRCLDLQWFADISCEANSDRLEDETTITRARKCHSSRCSSLLLIRWPKQPDCPNDSSDHDTITMILKKRQCCSTQPFIVRFFPFLWGRNTIACSVSQDFSRLHFIRGLLSVLKPECIYSLVTRGAVTKCHECHYSLMLQWSPVGLLASCSIVNVSLFKQQRRNSKASCFVFGLLNSERLRQGYCQLSMSKLKYL